MNPIECHGLDTHERVCFYEQDFYVLSNFSSFTLQWKGLRFDTSEAAYHWEKYPDRPDIQEAIRLAPSAHEAYQIAAKHKSARRADWDDVKVEIMRDILYAKVEQHEYVKRKLLATGDRELVENSWRDDFWGWGPNRDGQNELGKLWMDVRAWLQIDAMTPAQVEEYLVSQGVEIKSFDSDMAKARRTLEAKLRRVNEKAQPRAGEQPPMLSALKI